MSKLNTELPQEQVESFAIWKAATGDGYWETAATNDIQLVYLLGQLRATESLHISSGSHDTRLRINRLRKEIAVRRKEQLS